MHTSRSISRIRHTRHLGSAAVLVMVALLLLAAPAVAHAAPELSGVNAYPNPVAPNGDGWAERTYFNFTLNGPAAIDVKVYDVGWHLVATPYRDVQQGTGFHSLHYDLWTEAGGVLPDGVYWYSIQARTASGSQAKGGLLFVSRGLDTAPALTGSNPHLDKVWAHPNPMTPDGDGVDDTAAFCYTLSTDAYVTVKVVDWQGEVKTVRENVFRAAGRHYEGWNGRDDGGHRIFRGNYRYCVFATSGGAKPITDLATGVIGITAFPPEPRRYEQGDANAAYTGRWANGTNWQLSKGTNTFSSQAGATANFKFRGTGIAWIGRKGPVHGHARVFLDGVSMGAISLYAPALSPQETVWSVAGLDDGDHTLTIKVLGDRDVASGGTWVGVDAIDVVGDGLLPALPDARAIFGYPWKTYLVIDKSDFRIYWIKDDVLVKSYPIAHGKPGWSTPVGYWRIGNKYYSSGVFGPRKMRMYRMTSSGSFAYTAYNIHGTNQEWVIGTRASHGCIRLYNRDILDLYPRVPLLTMVVTRQ